MVVTDSNVRVSGKSQVHDLDRTQGALGEHEVALGTKIDSMRASTVRGLLTSLIDGMRSLGHRIFGSSEKAVDALKDELDSVSVNDNICPLDYSSGKPDIIADRLKNALKGEIGLHAKMKMLSECHKLVEGKVARGELTVLQGKQLNRMLLDVFFDEMQSWGMHIDMEDVYSAITVGQLKAVLGEDAFEDYHGNAALEYPDGRSSVIRDLDKYDDHLRVGDTGMDVGKLMQRLDTNGGSRMHASQLVNRLDIDTVVKLARFDSLQEEGDFVSILARLHEKDSAHEAKSVKPAVALIQSEIEGIVSDNLDGVEAILDFSEEGSLWGIQTNFEKALHGERTVMAKLQAFEDSVDLIDSALSDGKITADQAKGLKKALINAFYDVFCKDHESKLYGELTANQVIGMLSLELVQKNRGSGVDKLPKGYEDSAQFLEKFITSKDVPLREGASLAAVDLRLMEIYEGEGGYTPMGCEVLPFMGSEDIAKLIDRGSDPMVVGVLDKLKS